MCDRVLDVELEIKGMCTWSFETYVLSNGLPQVLMRGTVSPPYLKVYYHTFQADKRKISQLYCISLIMCNAKHFLY